jgi:hypothetical protein
VIGPALASSLSSASNSVGAGKTSVGRCDTDGVSTLYNLSSSNVVSVAVAGVASGCAGATLKVTVNNGTTTSSGSASVPAGGGSMTVTVTSIALSQSMSNDISVL